MENRNIWILRISCLLSIIGSIIVMIACRFPKKIWKKKGRQLIFWLSFSDLGTSIVYFISSFDQTNNKNSKLCQTYSLLGIFFPVASFIWTDFIGYYLFSMINSRKLTTDKEWKYLMRWFHLISWGISGICITLVGGFHHAGRSEKEEDNSENTGGWCWVVTSKYSNLILWEIIGGKCVEWLSCFIILPYLYYSTAKTLIQLDHSSNTKSSTSLSINSSKSLQSLTVQSTLSSSSNYPPSLPPPPPPPTNLSSPYYYPPQTRQLSSTSIGSNSNLQPLSHSPSNSTSTNTASSSYAFPITPSSPSTIQNQQQQESFRNPKFQKFYIKMVCYLFTLFSLSPSLSLELTHFNFNFNLIFRLLFQFFSFFVVFGVHYVLFFMLHILPHHLLPLLKQHIMQPIHGSI